MVIGYSPLKLVSNRDLVVHVKSKVNQIRAAAQKTFVTILDVDTTALGESGST